MTRDRVAEIGRFRAAVACRLGLGFDDGKLDYLGEVLERRLAATRLDPDRYLDRVGSGADRAEIGALAHELTVPETYFFRHTAQFQALTRRALPDRIAARGAERRLRLLSAGCATGEEAYSLAIAARGVAPAGWEISVRGIDVNQTLIDRARRGQYTEWALRETTPAQARRWFTRLGRACRIDPALRDVVRFDVRNLIEDDAEVWAPHAYDIVFVRNVLMYFEPAQARAAMARIAGALQPGGFLFLGHAETMRGVSDAFVLCHTDDAFYYQRRDGAHAPATTWDEPPASPVASAGLSCGLGAGVRSDAGSGVISGCRSGGDAGDARPAATPPSWNLAPVRECLRQERYADAAAAIAALPAAASADPDVLLHTAVVETHRGRLADAEAACARLLDADRFSAGAHYVLALCREAAGEPGRAEHHDRIAIYLDPAFAMPHLHLGLLARRLGDRAAARRTLEHAATLLARESEARLLLLGGGFGRESLVALCRSEIARLERPA